MAFENLTIRASEYPAVIDMLVQAAEKVKRMPHHDANPTETARDLLLVATTACVKYPEFWDNFQNSILEMEEQSKKKPA